MIWDAIAPIMTSLYCPCNIYRTIMYFCSLMMHIGFTESGIYWYDFEANSTFLNWFFSNRFGNASRAFPTVPYSPSKFITKSVGCWPFWTASVIRFWFIFPRSERSWMSRFLDLVVIIRQRWWCHDINAFRNAGSLWVWSTSFSSQRPRCVEFWVFSLVSLKVICILQSTF